MDQRFKLKKYLDEVFFIEPNDLGLSWLTGLYKGLANRMKTFPLIVIIPISLLVTLGIYFLIGALIVKLVGLLQYGF